MLYYRLTGSFIDNSGKKQEMQIVEKCQEELIATRPEEMKEVIRLQFKQLNDGVIPDISYDYQLITLVDFNKYIIEDNFEYIEIPTDNDQTPI
jgi:hypothetical protein